MNMEVTSTERKHVDEVMNLLQSLSNFYPEKKNYDDLWDLFDQQENVFSVVVLDNDNVVGYGSIVIEVKIRGGKMAHIEDIVSHPDYRNMGIGKKIMDSLSNIAKQNYCYKIALQCREDKIEFYKKCGYEVSGCSMQMFLKY